MGAAWGPPRSTTSGPMLGGSIGPKNMNYISCRDIFINPLFGSGREGCVRAIWSGACRTNLVRASRAWRGRHGQGFARQIPLQIYPPRIISRPLIHLHALEHRKISGPLAATQPIENLFSKPEFGGPSDLLPPENPAIEVSSREDEVIPFGFWWSACAKNKPRGWPMLAATGIYWGARRHSDCIIDHCPG